MGFSKFSERFQQNFAELTKEADTLFEIDVDKDEFWNLYLDSYPEGTNEIFRQKREFDCNCCKQFIRAIGNTAVIKDNKVTTIWAFDTGSPTFQPVVDALNDYLLSRIITNVYITTEKQIGKGTTIEKCDNGTSIVWSHFSLTLPNKFVSKSGSSIGELKGKERDIRNVFNRSLKEISEDAIQTVLELIRSNSLYKGEEWKVPLERFLAYKKEFDVLSDSEKECFSWAKYKEAGITIGKIRNHSIGTLLVDLSDGEELDHAVKKYEKIVAPANYKRPKAIFTKKMLEDAKKQITELGYMNSLPRRFASIEDITVNNILFINKDAAKKIGGGMDVFDEMMGSVKTSPKKFSRVEEISIDKFINDVIPSAESIEAYVESKHSSNFVSLIAPLNADAPTMFKWDNGFSWAYSGNIADSDITQRVQAAGGRTDGVLRFSHSWNYEGMRNASLMDLHVFMPGSTQKEEFTNKKETHDFYGNAERVGWNHRNHYYSGGIQDVDYTAPAAVGYIPVENITFPDINRLKEGIYKFKIHNWQLRRPTTGGFKAEIAFGGQVYRFVHKAPLGHKEWVTLAELELKNGEFKILKMAESDSDPIEVWGIKTNQFVPVTTIMYSPNYWDGQNGSGHKHFLFMLKDCVNDENPNGFYNEYLKNELMEHKRVFEALGAKMAVESVDNQLSGLGFSSTKRNDLIVKVKGRTERIMKIKF